MHKDYDFSSQPACGSLEEITSYEPTKSSTSLIHHHRDSLSNTLYSPILPRGALCQVHPQCRRCGKTFTTKGLLLAHVRIKSRCTRDKNFIQKQRAQVQAEPQSSPAVIIPTAFSPSQASVLPLAALPTPMASDTKLHACC